MPEMAKKIVWTYQAQSRRPCIDRQTALNLLHGLARFALIDEGGVKQLQGIDPPEFHDLGHSIEILRIRHRSAAYR